MVARTRALRGSLGASGPVVPRTPIRHRSSAYLCSRSRPAARRAAIRPPETGRIFRLSWLGPLVAAQIRFWLCLNRLWHSERACRSHRAARADVRMSSKTTEPRTDTAVFAVDGCFGWCIGRRCESGTTARWPVNDVVESYPTKAPAAREGHIDSFRGRLESRCCRRGFEHTCEGDQAGGGEQRRGDSTGG
jgi:hypothetical protein